MRNKTTGREGQETEEDKETASAGAGHSARAAARGTASVAAAYEGRGAHVCVFTLFPSVFPHVFYIISIRLSFDKPGSFSLHLSQGLSTFNNTPAALKTRENVTARHGAANDQITQSQNSLIGTQLKRNGCLLYSHIRQGQAHRHRAKAPLRLSGHHMGAYDPSGHDLPVGHGCGADDPSGQKDPAGHSTDDVGMGQKRPLGHASHDFLPAHDTNVPGRHLIASHMPGVSHL